MFRSIALVVVTALIASCASGPPRMSNTAIERALVGAPGAAQPGKIVAVESAFSRAAREDGQWTAFRSYMAPGAQIHGRNGPINAAAFLANLDDPAEAVQWGARSVWMSCDGKLAVSRGRFLDPEGKVGTFVTLWQQQDDRDYRWLYDLGSPDDPQPAAALRNDDGSIVVSADEIIQGHVADCPTAANPLPPPSPSVIANTTNYGGGKSPDGTLLWRWEHHADGTRRLFAQYLSEGVWQTALSQSFAPVATD